MDENGHSALLFARERRASQTARLRSERMEEHCLDAFALVASPRLTIPRRTTGLEKCCFRCWHTADPACYCCRVVCMPSPACLLEHARSSQTHNKDGIVSSHLDTPVIPLRHQQSSLILPVFTNWPFSCSSDPGTHAFVCKTPRNSSLPPKHRPAS